MHAGPSVLRRPALIRSQSSARAAYFAEVFGSRRVPWAVRPAAASAPSAWLAEKRYGGTSNSGPR